MFKIRLIKKSYVGRKFITSSGAAFILQGKISTDGDTYMVAKFKGESCYSFTYSLESILREIKDGRYKWIN